MFCLLLAGILHLAPLPADTVRSAAPTLPRLTLSLATANRTVYLQRAPEPQDDRGYLGTTLLYQAPSGFMASGYLNHSYAYTFLHEPFINYGEAMVGWQSVGSGDTYWTTQYTRLFVYGESALVQASLRNDLSASLTHYFDYVTASASADVFVGGTRDFILTFNLSHPFELPVLAHDTLTIEPTAEFGAGSQHFYANSLGKSTVVKTKRRGNTTVYTEPATPGFAALGYTLSVPVTYRTRRFSLEAIPSLLVPLNVPTGGDTRSLFYGTVGASLFLW